MTSHILGIYPVIIVILVYQQKSYIDTSTSAWSQATGSMQFTSSRSYTSGETTSWGGSTSTRLGSRQTLKPGTPRSKPKGLGSPRNHVVEFDIPGSELEMHSLPRHPRLFHEPDDSVHDSPMDVEKAVD